VKERFGVFVLGLAARFLESSGRRLIAGGED